MNTERRELPNVREGSSPVTWRQADPAVRCELPQAAGKAFLSRPVCSRTASLFCLPWVLGASAHMQLEAEWPIVERLSMPGSIISQQGALLAS